MRAALSNLKLRTLDVVYAGAPTFPLMDRIRAVALPGLPDILQPLPTLPLRWGRPCYGIAERVRSWYNLIGLATAVENIENYPKGKPIHVVAGSKK